MTKHQTCKKCNSGFVGPDLGIGENLCEECDGEVRGESNRKIAEQDAELTTLCAELAEAKRNRFHCGWCDEQFVSIEETRNHIKTCPEHPMATLIEKAAAVVEAAELDHDFQAMVGGSRETEALAYAINDLRIAAWIKAAPQDGDAGDRADEAYEREYK